MSIREALMEMAHGKKPKTERAAWVPESILDDDVSHFMGAAAAAKKAGKSHFDFGGKKYKVTMKSDAAKKIAEATFATDIDYNEEDNIKKVAKRFGVKVRFVDVGGPTEMQMTGDKNKIMKAVKALGFTDKEIKNAYFKESAGCPECGADGECQCEQPVEEAKINELSKGTLDRYRQVAYNDRIRQSGNRQKGEDDTPGMKKRDAGIALATKKSNAKGPGFEPKSRPGGDVLKFKSKKESVEQVDEVSYKTAMKSYQKAMGQSKDADDAGDKKTGDKKFDQAVKFGRYANKKFQSSKNKKKLVRTLSRQVPLGTLTKEEPVEEATKATAQHKPTPETSDTWDKQLATRKGEKDFIDQHTMDVALDAEKMYDQNKYEAMKKTPVRNGDKTDGDKKVVNPLSTDMVTGMRKALAQMKLSGE